jgi:hypothetical protein
MTIILTCGGDLFKPGDDFKSILFWHYDIGVDVKEYACTSISDLAELISMTIASVAPPRGEK